MAFLKNRVNSVFPRSLISLSLDPSTSISTACALTIWGATDTAAPHRPGSTESLRKGAAALGYAPGTAPRKCVDRENLTSWAAVNPQSGGTMGSMVRSVSWNSGSL